MARFDGAVVWITGGGSGIGKACAVEFARQGARVAVSGRRLDKLDEAIAAIEGAGGQALGVACDVTDEEACRTAVAEILETWGRLDVAVANAGYAVAGYASKLTVDDFRRQFETNVFGLLNTVYAALPALKESKGRIALVGSVASFISPPRLAAYAGTKAAVRAIGESFSHDLARDGVSVTVLCPGYVESEIQQVNNEGIHRPDAPVVKHPLMVPADKAARDIVKAVHKRRLIVPITGHGAVIIWMKRHFPAVMRAAIARF
jgi:NAD(P)-dependent dehydrogenase (short-subunit alcohol dehydrogenase family)